MPGRALKNKNMNILRKDAALYQVTGDPRKPYGLKVSHVAMAKCLGINTPHPCLHTNSCYVLFMKNSRQRPKSMRQ